MELIGQLIIYSSFRNLIKKIRSSDLESDQVYKIRRRIREIYSLRNPI